MAKRNRYKNLGPVLISFTAILAVIGMIFETVAILFGYDPVMRVFKLRSSVASASVAALFIISIAMISIAICVGKLGKMRSKAPGNGLSDTVSTVGGFALAAFSTVLLVQTFKKWAEMEQFKLSPLDMFTVILFAVSIPTALYFFLGTAKGDKRTTFLAFFPPIWNAMCLVRLYFDAETAINDPVRILLQITLVTVMLALMYELKLRVKGTGKVMFTVTASLSTVLACSSFMSVMLLFVIVKVGTVADMLLSMGTLFVSLYLLMRLSAYYKPIKERD